MVKITSESWAEKDDPMFTDRFHVHSVRGKYSGQKKKKVSKLNKKLKGIQMPPQLDRLQEALNFMISHIPGASEISETLEKKTTLSLDMESVGTANIESIDEANTTIPLENNQTPNPESDLLEEAGINPTDIAERGQKALDIFIKKNLTNLEVGRLYERYIGYLYETDKYTVGYKGILSGLNDLGRDLVAIKGNEHLIIQAKCWSKHKRIHVKHIYQLHASLLHYRYQLRQALKNSVGKQKARELMRTYNIRALICASTDLSPEAQDVVNYLNVIEFRKEKLDKTYPMIKCNIGKETREKIYHLPFDSQYDSIIIGNVEDGEDKERYVHTTIEAEALGFRRSEV